jgi:CDP-glycerol glycerophosphotransferase (TagB/SpsB family)
MQSVIELKKTINIKPSIKIIIPMHHWISDNKNFETRSHWLYFDKKYSIF